MPLPTANKIFSPHYREIFLFSAPILMAMVIQNAMGLLDNSFVGLIGTEALAAYGISFFLLFIHVAPLMGLATAVQALTAKALGQGEKRQVASSLNAALIASLGAGALITLVSSFYLDTLVGFMTKDPAVIKLAHSYLPLRFVGVFAIGITHSFRGFWNGLGRPQTYLFIMIASYIVNAAVSYSLLPTMGLAGVALGSTVATVFASVVNFIYAFSSTKEFGFTKGFFNKKAWKELLEQSFPSGLQQLLFALGFAVFFAIIGRLGARELAAANVLVTISLFLIYPAMGMGMTAATYVGKGMGARDIEQAFFWTKEIAKFSSLLFGVLSLPLIYYSGDILSLFIHDIQVIELARLPLNLFLATLLIEALGNVYVFAFLGAGKPKVVLITTVMTQWLGILPFSFMLGSSLETIWLIQIVFRCLQALFLMFYWRKSLQSASVAACAGRIKIESSRAG